METKHTPGPWFTKREGFSTVYVEARIGGGFLQEVAACGPTAAGIQQQDSNAKLIAAAPDLLEALQILASIPIEDFGKESKPDYPLMAWNGTYLKVSDVLKARAAIKKATQ